jgi:hypothetical protein
MQSRSSGLTPGSRAAVAGLIAIAATFRAKPTTGSTGKVNGIVTMRPGDMDPATQVCRASDPVMLCGSPGGNKQQLAERYV